MRSRRELEESGKWDEMTSEQRADFEDYGTYSTDELLPEAEEDEEEGQ